MTGRRAGPDAMQGSATRGSWQEPSDARGAAAERGRNERQAARGAPACFASTDEVGKRDDRADEQHEGERFHVGKAFVTSPAAARIRSGGSAADPDLAIRARRRLLVGDE